MTHADPYPAAPPPAPIRLRLEHRVAAAPPRPSPDVTRVAAMFGLGLDRGRSLAVVPACDLTLAAGSVVFVTGPSGAGKSTLLRLIGEGLAERDDAATIRFDALPPLPDRPLVDALPAPTLDDRLRLLSLAGLGDVPVMLRRPSELSEGQRHRLRLAQCMAAVETKASERLGSSVSLLPAGEGSGEGGALEAHGSPGPTVMRRPTLAPTLSLRGRGGRTMTRAVARGEGDRGDAATPLTVVLADEFGATLDRRTAMYIAASTRKWVRRRGDACLVAATTHDDLLEPLDPEVLVELPLGEAVRVFSREAST